LAVVIAGATWGAQRLAAYVQRLRRLRIVATTAQRLLRRHGLATRGQRLLVLEHHSARRIGLLTECARQAMWRLRNDRLGYRPPNRFQFRSVVAFAKDVTNDFGARVESLF